MKTILRSLMCIAALLLVSVAAYSVPAYPGLIDFKQPDGQVIKIKLFGDEFLHWASTEDDYTLLYDDKGFLVYAEKNAVTGNMVPSKLRPTPKKAKRTVNELQFLNKVGKQLSFSTEQVQIAQQAVAAFNNNISNGMQKGPQKARWKDPVVGKLHFVTILVEYQDVHFKYTKEDFEKLMNQLNYHENGAYGSVRDFYLENSFGKLDITTDVYGVYRLSGNMEKYGHSTGNMLLLAPEAIRLADNDVDFSKYDNDGDGIVEGVHIVYAGEGAEAGNRTNVWSHASQLFNKCDGVTLSRYCCTAEVYKNKLNGIGVVCHEFGHVLGALDYYDTDYQSGGQYDGTSKWDLMASGSWNGNGYCPAHFNPYSKIYDFGWAEPLSGNFPLSFKLKAKDENGFVRIDTKTEGEFFLVEYRSQTGFDVNLPGHGLMIYRASKDLDTKAQRWQNNTNATHPQHFYPLCANAKVDIPTKSQSSYGSVDSKSTPFPGTLNVREITDLGTPSMKS